MYWYIFDCIYLYCMYCIYVFVFGFVYIDLYLHILYVLAYWLVLVYIASISVYCIHSHE